MYVRKKGSYNVHPGKVGLHYINMTKHSMYFGRITLARSSLSVVNFYGSLLGTQFPADEKVTSYIPKISYWDAVFKADATAQRNWSMLRQEQKSIVHSHDTMRKYSKPDTQVVDLRLNTGFIAKTRFLHNRRRKFIGCARNSKRFWELEPFPISLFAFQTPNTHDDRKEGKGLSSATWTVHACWKQHSGEVA